VESDEIEDLAGLAKRNPLAAFTMLIFVFALAGIPPTAGFIGKFYIFMAAVHADLVWLAVLIVVGSGISIYFYLNVIMVMYMKEPDSTVELTPSRPTILALAVAAVAVMILGVYPGPVIDFANQAILSFPSPVIAASP